MKKILIVDDEQQMRMMLTLYLRNDFELFEAIDGEEALHIFKENEIDLVLLDVMMPKLDGIEACKQMKNIKPDVPIIMLTALNETSQKVEGLMIGADDYMVKPFEPEELLARIHVQFRHFEKNQSSSNRLVYAELTIDLSSHEVTVNGKEIKYSPKEFDLLYLLAAHPNRVYTREQLLDIIWGLDEVVDIRTVDSHVRYVRDKLKKAGITKQPVETVWGVGYKFDWEDKHEAE
ncbi:response regulator transcription factor [Gracilibacillus caseinilyticus]|uniref:Response regulator transcription factor n=1 Tax=Gracilibacillus caseinilyticus TaxID=2932256 RepID=A0ABY4EQN1_9BACI|nr:response regulator transcription factor [Gracilibacillus caseinilyticus]UOQ46761.1 response regulator transcription factor [Gracilibacillus caseinilyticus]